MSALRFEVLGSLRVTRDGREVGLGPAGPSMRSVGERRPAVVSPSTHGCRAVS